MWCDAETGTVYLEHGGHDHHQREGLSYRNWLVHDYRCPELAQMTCKIGKVGGTDIGEYIYSNCRKSPSSWHKDTKKIHSHSNIPIYTIITE